MDTGLTPATTRYLTTAQAALDRGEKVLIIGSKASNFPQRLREDDRFEFWDSTDPSSWRRELPTYVGATICLRFIPHTMHQRLREDAKARGWQILPPLQGTGQANKLLRLLAGPQSTEEVVPTSPDVEASTAETNPRLRVITVTPPKDPRNSGLHAILAKLSNIKELGRGEVKPEAERLLPKVAAIYPQATVAEIYYALYRLKRKVRQPKKTKAKVKTGDTTETGEPLASLPPPTPSLPREDLMASVTAACETLIRTLPHLLATMAKVTAERDELRERLDLLTEAWTRPTRPKA